MTIELNDILGYGTLTSAKVVYAEQTMKAGKPILRTELEVDGIVHRVGIIGKESIESFLKHAKKVDGGKHTVEIPQKLLLGEKMAWLTNPY